jgi:hypothetical protein
MNVAGRGLSADDLMEFGVWIVTLLVTNPDLHQEEQFVSDVPVCARDVKGAEAAARAWTTADQMEPVRMIQARYVCGVKAVDASGDPDSAS